jgi:hypothetical protein
MTETRKKKTEIRKSESSRLVVLILLDSEADPAKNEYRRSFLQQRLIRGWIGIFVSLTGLALLADSLLNRLLR